MTYTYDNYIDVVDIVLSELISPKGLTILIKSFLKVGGVLIGLILGVSI